MLIYLGAFAVSVGIAAYGEHLRTKKNNEKGFYLCLALAVLVMAVLAGLRDPSIGTDSVVYEGWVADAKLIAFSLPVKYIEKRCSLQGTPSQTFMFVLVFFSSSKKHEFYKFIDILWLMSNDFQFRNFSVREDICHRYILR